MRTSLVVVRCGRLQHRPGHRAVDPLAIFVAVALVVSSTALMLDYRTRPVSYPPRIPSFRFTPTTGRTQSLSGPTATLSI